MGLSNDHKITGGGAWGEAGGGVWGEREELDWLRKPSLRETEWRICGKTQGTYRKIDQRIETLLRTSKS